MGIGDCGIVGIGIGGDSGDWDVLLVTIKCTFVESMYFIVHTGVVRHDILLVETRGRVSSAILGLEVLIPE